MQNIRQLPMHKIANLSQEEIEAYKKIALMEAGIVELPQPVLTEPPTLTGVPRITVWEVGGLYFAKRSDAEAVCKMSIGVLDYEYSVGYNVRYFDTDRILSVNAVETYSKDVYYTHLKQLQAHNERKEAYEKELRKWKENVCAVNKVTHDIDALYEEACSRSRLMKQIKDTWLSYLSMCDLDVVVAARFICRAFVPDDVREAREWFPDDMNGLTDEILGEAITYNEAHGE